MLDTLSTWALRYTAVILPCVIIGFIVQTRPEGAVAFGTVMGFYASMGFALYVFSRE